MQGKTVAILESRLGQQMVDLISKRGGKPLHAPALAELPDVDPDYIAKLVPDLRSQPADMAIFQTGVGTNALFRTTDALGLTDAFLRLLEAMTVVARGPKPTAVLRGRGVRIDLSAKEPFTTAEVLEALAATQLRDRRVIVQRYGVTNLELEKALEERGARVIEIPTYRWSLPEDTRPLIDLIESIARGQVDAVTFTNAAQVYNLFAVAQERGRAEALKAGLNRTLTASIGPVCSEALKKFGVAIGLEASPPKLGPFIAALDQALAR